jgi:hypothetical protein
MNWKSITTAPRDGTVIELKNSYGILPTFSLCRWTESGWRKHDDPMSGVIDGPHLEWREYGGGEYRDYNPTMEDWQRAARGFTGRAAVVPPLRTTQTPK